MILADTFLDKFDPKLSEVELTVFRDNLRPEVVSAVISGVAVGWVGVDVLVKCGDSRSNCSRDIRLPHFVTDYNDDERRRPTDLVAIGRQNALQRYA